MILISLIIISIFNIEQSCDLKGPEVIKLISFSKC